MRPSAQISVSPQLSTLRSQTAAIIKQAILSGQWQDHLPSEAELCRTFKVARITVRSAVMDLVSQNLIALGGRGRNHKILAQPLATLVSARTPKPKRIIRYLSNEAFHQLGEATTKLFVSAEAKLAERGYELAFEFEPGLYSRFNKARLEEIAARPNTVGWILFRASRQIQSWFQKMEIPAIISGSAYPGVELPSVRIDYYSACRHAALSFLERGHSNLAVVTPSKRIASENEGIQGFLSVQTERPDVRISLIEHDSSMKAIVQGTLASRLGNKPVTGYLVMEPQIAITVLTILQFSGIPVPAAASIISRAGNSSMVRVLPTIAHYKFDAVSCGRLVAKTLLSRIERGQGAGIEAASEVTSLKFIPGGSLGNL